MNNTIVLCPNPYRDRGLALTLQAKKILEDAGFKAIVSPVFVEIPENSPMTPLQDSAAEASMIISFGGDGTFLHVARAVIGSDIPLLGVNVGTKGFMASIEPEEIALVARAAAGEFRQSRRMTMEVELQREGGIIYKNCAINDVVVKSDVSCIGLNVTADGVGISCFSGDGVIIATPTGSTAYSMSAGGPIVEPEAHNLLVTPICAHVMAATAFVLSSERRLVVTPERLRGRRALLSVDGSEAMELEGGDEIHVFRSKNSVIVADMGIRSFYDTAFDKLTHCM
ncbi:MAG: NAD(+)/NADH kinase [Oscillospiraceae bacterium]